MSAQGLEKKSARPVRRLTIPELTARKDEGRPIVCLTAYHAHTAALLDSHVDLLLVGDSLGMVMYGMDSTLGVTLDMMIAHGAAVVRGSQQALIVVDMPFGSYEESPVQAFHNAVRVIKETGCQAVKIEGGRHMAATISYLEERGIPVMAHIGLTPQNVNVMGGFVTQGCRKSEWDAFLQDAEVVEKSGAFAVVLEGMAAALADKITENLRIPTIGIGASVTCDGQILVTEDMLGLSQRVPRFVHKFANLQDAIIEAVGDYADAVRMRSFPASENTYEMQDNESIPQKDL